MLGFPQTPYFDSNLNAYLFFVCLYVNRFLVLCA